MISPPEGELGLGTNTISLKPKWPSRLGSIATFVVTIGLLSLVAFQGWIPHDEGTLGRAAVEIMEGRWPHSEFLDVYPGLQGVLHAGVFHVLGVSIWSLRIAWLGVAGLTSVALFLLLKRHVSLAMASVGAVGAVVFGFVLYPASMPTWWNLMFGAWSLVFVIRGSARQSRSMIVLAGLISGASILTKPVGGYIAITVFLWLLAGSSRVASKLLGVACLLGILAVSLAILPIPSAGRVVQFWIPAVGSIVWIWYDAERREPDESEPWSRTSPWIYLAFTSLPIILVVFVYSVTGRGSSLVDGWITSPALRYERAVQDVPFMVITLLVLLGGFFLGRQLRWNSVRILCLMLAVAGSIAWIVGGWVGPATWAILSILSLPLIIVAFGMRRTLDGSIPREVVLICASAAIFALVQIPVWSGYYTAYTIPLLMTSALLLIKKGSVAFVSTLAIVALVFLGQSAAGKLIGPQPVESSVRYVDLAIPRGGIKVPAHYSYYIELSNSLHGLIAGGEAYAGPDSPQVTFLAGVRSATPGLFEALDLGWEPNSVGDLADAGVPVVINSDPEFSEAFTPNQLSRIYAALPKSDVHGPFEVRWRE